MAWLDALRGFAALVVAWYHISPSVIGGAHHGAIHKYIDLGKYGVLLFFLVSGYVIPMSLERHGSPRKFWVGRLFRIYPAYLVTIAAVLAFVAADVIDLQQSLRAETVTGVLSHVTMMQDFVGIRGLVWPFWTLGFEMAFYLIVAGMFVWGLHRLSAWWAAGLALIAVAAGPALPNALFGGDAAARRLTAAALVLVLGLSLIAYLSGRRTLVAAAGLAGLAVIALPLLNGHSTRWSTATSSWQAVLMLSIMFAGTVIYRLHHAQINRLAGFGTLALVLAASAVATWLHTGTRAELTRWTIISVAVAATFALGFALRHRRVPAVLTWLGAVSYSLYLLHFVVLLVVVHYIGKRNPTVGDRVTLGVCFAVGSLLVAWLSYRYIELPGQRLGRHAQRLLDNRLGPDRARRGPDKAPVATESAVVGTGRGEKVSRTV